MLGTEYNWLVTLTGSSREFPRVRLSGTGVITLWVAAFCLLAVILTAAPNRVSSTHDAAAAPESLSTKR